MRLLTDREGDYPYLWEWLNRRTGLPWCTDMRTIGLCRDDGRLIAVMAACNFMHGKQCFIHFAADEAISRRFLVAVFSYLFGHAGMESVLGLFDSGNKNILRFVQRVGFEKKCDLYGSVLYEMRPEICKWLTAAKPELHHDRT